MLGRGGKEAVLGRTSPRPNMAVLGGKSRVEVTCPSWVFLLEHTSKRGGGEEVTPLYVHTQRD